MNHMDKWCEFRHIVTSAVHTYTIDNNVSVLLLVRINQKKPPGPNPTGQNPL